MFQNLSKRLAKTMKPVVPFPVRHGLRRVQRTMRLGRFKVEKSDVIYVQTIVGLCGGVRVIFEHVARLRARGYKVAVWCVCGDGSWFPRDVPVYTFGSVEKLRQAVKKFRGIKIACWYETAPIVAESLQPGDRGYYLVQDIEEWYHDSPEKLVKVRKSYELGLKPIVEGEWVEQQLRERFHLDPIQVHIGLDLETFHPHNVERRPNQLMTQARTWSGGIDAGFRIKGWQTARRVFERCRELNSQTELVTFSLEHRPRFEKGTRHEHHKYPTDVELARLYSRAGLYLLTSRHEGFGLTAAEAMACGCPVVSTLADGNEEFCVDGVTALMAEPDDVERLSQHCHRLQTDPELATELSLAARQFIMQYSWERVIDRLEAEFAREDEAIELPAPKFDAGKLNVPISAVEYPDLELAEKPACDWTVVIPTVGGVGKVVECVNSCRQFAEDRRVEIVVVDDGCTDPLVRELLQEAADELNFELRLNHQNLGFGAAVNHGLRGARGRFALVCNNDILFDRPWPTAAESAFVDRRIGIVGARLLYPDGIKIQHAGTEKVPGQLIYVHAHHR